MGGLFKVLAILARKRVLPLTSDTNAWPASGSCQLSELRLDETARARQQSGDADQTKPEPLRSPLLDKARAQASATAISPARAVFPSGIYRGLNIGTGSNDDPAKVRENRRRVADWMGVPAEPSVDRAIRSIRPT